MVGQRAETEGSGVFSSFYVSGNSRHRIPVTRRFTRGSWFLRLALVLMGLSGFGNIAQATVLTNGQPVSGSVAQGATHQYQITAPAGVTQVAVQLDGLSADADLYLRAHQPPGSSYNCGPELGGTRREVCLRTNSGATTWYIHVYGYQASVYTLQANLIDGGAALAPGITTLTSGAPQNGAIQQYEIRYYQIAASAAVTSVNVTLTGLSGDADLYLRANQLPQGSNYQCSSEAGGTNNENCTVNNVVATVWFIEIYGYQSAGYTITAQLNGDEDNDGVGDSQDQCPGTLAPYQVDANGCAAYQLDADGDGVTNDIDICPNTPANETADAFGCSDSQRDTDNDGVNDATDLCPNTPPTESVDPIGCSASQIDSDSDGVNDALDLCPNTTTGQSVNAQGCSVYQLDADNDGVVDALDQCPNTPLNETADPLGCSPSQQTVNEPQPFSATTTYSYDELGRLIQVVHPNAVANDYEYDAADNRTSKESSSN